MKKLIGYAGVAALALGLGGCDSTAENVAEEQVETAEDIGEAKIDEMEAAGEMTSDEADAANDALHDKTDAAMEALDDTDPETLGEAKAVVEDAMEAN